jgi:SAM-dependent methyltransferase
MRWEQLGSSYDRVAARYEERFWTELEGKPYDRSRLAAFAAAASDPVAEIGCGPGQVGAFVAGAGRRVVGLDLSPEMARRAAAHLGAAAVGDMRALPLRDAACGGLLAFYSVIHVRRGELSGVLGEFRRVLAPGGRLLLSAHEGDGEAAQDEFLGLRTPFAATLFQLDELVAATTAAGLAVVGADRRPPYPEEHPTHRLYLEAVRV